MAVHNLRHERKNWVDYNQALCKSLFDNSPLYGSHGYGYGFILSNTSLAQDVEGLKKDIWDAVNDLESIDQRLDLYEETTPIIEKCRQAKTKVIAYKEKLQKEIPGYIKAIILGIIGSLIATVIVTYIAC